MANSGWSNDIPNPLIVGGNGQTGQIILLGETGTQTGSLDGVNGLELVGNGTVANPGLTLSPLGDLVWGNFNANAVAGPSIEAGDTSLTLSAGSNTGETAPQLVLDTELPIPSATVSGIMATQPIYSRQASGNAEIWHTFSPLQNSWTQDTNADTFSYKQDALGFVRFRGGIIAGTKTDGTIVTNIPAPYRPTKQQLQLCTHESLAGAARVQISTNGDIAVFDVSTAVGLRFDQVSYSLI